jgi:hypothetical protein
MIDRCSTRTRRTRIALLFLLLGSLLACDGPTEPDPLQPAGFGVTSAAPMTGATRGNSLVTILGSGFKSGVRATVDGIDVPSSVVTSVRLTVSMPPHAAGSVEIVVIDVAGASAKVPGTYVYFVPPYRVFTEVETGFSTMELRDADEQILKIDQTGYLVWEDGSEFPGYAVTTGFFKEIFIEAGQLCGCALDIRFGSVNGNRRAYLTGEYGHFNPGTVLDLEVVGGVLVAKQTGQYVPGTHTLSGVVTEMTASGPAPVAKAHISIPFGGGHREAQTDASGVYTLNGLPRGTHAVSFSKSGYVAVTRTLSLSGDSRVDVELIRN